MKSRKRAPGGGRKPAGEFAGLTVSKSWRMPADLLDLLEKSREERAKRLKKKISLGQELLYRLRDSFKRDSERDRLTRSVNSTLRWDVSEFLKLKIHKEKLHARSR